MQKKLGLVTLLSRHLVGEWAGDPLIITGDETDYSPFPPHGEWKKKDLSACASPGDEPSNLYELTESSEQFSESHTEYYSYQWSQAHGETVLKKLGEFCEGKYHYVVNLTKKEFLDPQAYKAGEKTVWDMMHEDNEVAIKSEMLYESVIMS